MSAYRNNGPHYDSALWLRQWVGSDHARVAELARALEGRATHIDDLKKAVWYIKDEIKRMQQDTQA